MEETKLETDFDITEYIVSLAEVKKYDANEYWENLKVYYPEVNWKKIYNTYKDLETPFAKYIIGYMHFKGNYIFEKNYTKAKEIFEKGVESNDIMSRFHLASIYIECKSVEKDYIKAIDLYSKNVELNHVGSINKLGLIYKNENNDAKAKELFEKGVELNNATSLYNLALLYEKDRYVGKDYVKAFELYSKNKDHAVSLNNLALLYKHGLGVEQNYEKAVSLFELSIKKNNGGAMNNLALMYKHGLGVEQNYMKAIELYEKAIELNDKYAMTNLGYLYQCGIGVEQNYIKAIKLYEKVLETDIELGSEYMKNIPKEEYVKYNILKNKNIAKINEENKKLKNEIAELKEKYEELMLLPGAPEVLEIKERFDSLKDST